MEYSFFIPIATIVIMVIIHLFQLVLNNRETIIANAIISAGLTLILSSIPALNDTIANLVAGFLNLALPETGNIYVLIGVGFLLLLLESSIGKIFQKKYLY